MASGINDRGDIVGFSRIQGFQGGPSTQFFIDDQIDPIDLTANGLTFTQTVHDINENGIIVGGGLKMDLDTGIVTDLGVPDPAGDVSFIFVESYAINDNEDVLPSGNPYLVGDADLDGTVDAQRFIVWNDHKFTSTAAWCGGDFNADGVIDGQDFIEWNNNKFTSADSASAVPEPGTCAVLLVAMMFATVLGIRGFERPTAV